VCELTITKSCGVMGIVLVDSKSAPANDMNYKSVILEISMTWMKLLKLTNILFIYLFIKLSRLLRHSCLISYTVKRKM